MKPYLIIIILGLVVYFLLKIILLILRPFFLKKFLEEIDTLYNKIKAYAVKDIDTAVENLKKWHAGGAIRIIRSEEELNQRLKDAQLADEHEKEVYEKFVRLRERFFQNPKKISDSITTCKRYLEVRLKQRQGASLFTDALTSGSITFEAFEAAAKETKIILEENERNLDILLDNQSAK